MNYLTLGFVAANGSGVAWKSKWTQAHIKELRTGVPSRVPAEYVPPDSDLPSEILKSIGMMCDHGEEAHEGLNSNARRALVEQIVWYTVFHKNDRELQSRAGIEPVVIEYRREGNEIGCYVNWGDFELGPGMKHLDNGFTQLTQFWERSAKEVASGLTNAPQRIQRDILVKMLHLPFISGVHAVHQTATSKDRPIALDVLAREYRDNASMNAWCKMHRDSYDNAQAHLAIGKTQSELWAQVHNKPWSTVHDEAFWSGAEAALELSLNQGKALDDIEREAQGWRAKSNMDAIADFGQNTDPDFVLKTAQQLLQGNPLPKVAAEVLDKTVGRGNWRFDPKQEVWLMRSIAGGKVQFSAVRRINDEYRSAVVNLSQSELATWWQRLAAGGGSQSQLPLFASTMKWLGDEKAMRREAEDETGRPGDFRKHWRPQESQMLARAKVLSRRLHSAHKFKWDDTFSKMAQEAAEQRPQTLLHDLLVTARLPYETGDVWFEWERTSAEVPQPEGLGVWGALMMPFANGMFRAAVVTPDGGVAPGTLLFDFRNPIPWSAFEEVGATPTTPQNWTVLGSSYIKRWEKGNREILDQLSQHAGVDLSNHPLYGDRPAELWASDVAQGKPEIAELVRRIAVTVGGIFRELMSGWALAVTHVDDEPLVEMTTSKTPTFHIGGGKFRPGYQYKNVMWRRPQELPKVLRKIRRIVRRREGMPQSQVSGHWAHRRAPNKDCAVHPRACGRRRQWQSTKRPEGLWDHDDKPLCPNDYQKCIYCDHVRWWVINHMRGDPKFGIIEKTYTITASTRRFRPPEPEPPLPVEPPPVPAPQLNAEADDE